MTDLQEFTNACLEALRFTEIYHGSDIPEGSELSEETRLNLEADCRSFWHRFGCFVMAEACVCNRDSKIYSKAAQAGHAFWMTRNGHGVGFWDGDWSDNYATMLAKGAKSYGLFEVCLGDDGLIWK